MKRSLCILLAFAPVAAAPASAEPALRHLKGQDIKKALSGREFTDETHWAERYHADGALTGAGMGKPYKKRWVVRANDLCVVDPPKDDACYEVWRAGNRLEMRRTGGDNFPKTGIVKR